ncbi:ATP adenylyltransferase-domain-containing protein [Globomyces pollinis-pini]|nr:ATP adenylyltransferase-domain-containing protein [Globomyces pollinis-pini]
MSLSNQIRTIFDHSLANGHLFLTPSSLSILREYGIDFQVRLAAALGLKPKTQFNGAPKVYRNPFLPPDPNLTVSQLDTHNILLNKFCIMKDHLLITTKEFESQFSTLNDKDFKAVLHVINELQKPEGLLFFYNCGSKSGASVNHKHIQMLRLDNDDSIPIHSVVMASNSNLHQVFQLKQFQFVHSCMKFNKETLTNIQLEDAIKKLLIHSKQQINPTLTTTDILSIDPASETEPNGFISYNVIFNSNWMMVVPRLKEGYQDLSFNINSVGFAGMVLTKSEDEFNQLKVIGPMKVLNSVTFSLFNNSL